MSPLPLLMPLGISFGMIAVALLAGVPSLLLRGRHDMYQWNRRGEVRSQDCLMIMVILVAGLVIATYAGEHFGWLGFLLGVPIGLAVAFGVLYGVVLLWVIVESLIWGGIPVLPPCRNEKCKSGLLFDFGDYEPAEHEGEWGGFRCRCGQLYLCDRKEGRVVEVLPDGTRKPFMVWKTLRGWRPDEAGAESKTQPDSERPA